ncbi:hypothetical protein ACGFIF_13035 [Kribbella sp. NPDC049174]|uniref:hypothetical protein n=1 Tax=Kribbella sp. NPDC049174 TaxID=3364112 RepID=UPI00372135C9
MKRTAPGVAAVMTALLLGVTGCGNDAGASTGTLQTPSATKGPAAARDKAAKNTLAGLVVLPRGYIADPRSTSGAFTATTFLGNWSADPALDRALLLNAGFVEGYRASRLSPDKKKRFTVQLFKAASPAKAKTLQQGFWSQDTHEKSFGVPNALSDARVQYDGGTGQSEAVAEVSFVVGSLVAELTIRQTGALGTDPRPDTALLKTLATQQKARLTTRSS